MKYKLIILEGPDCAGKTELAKKLEERARAQGYLATIHHHGPYLGCPNIVHRYLKSIEAARDIFNDTESVVIMDRSWLSEHIYATHMRGVDSRISGMDDKYLCAKTQNTPGVVVMCLPPLSVVLQKYRVRKHEEYVDNEWKLAKIHEAYRDLYSTLPVNKVIYNYLTDPTAEFVFSEVMP